MTTLTIPQKIALQTLDESPYGCIQSKWTRKTKKYPPFYGTGEISWQSARQLQALGYADSNIEWSFLKWYITDAGRAALEEQDGAR